MDKDANGSGRVSIPVLAVIGAGLILLGISLIFLLGEPGPAWVEAAAAGVRPAVVNYAAPELTLTNLQGGSVSLAGLRGQVVLVNLWATWCPPCKAEMPTLQAYYDRHRDEGFVVVAINDGDPAAQVREFVREYRLTFPVWLDPTYIASEKAFNTLNLPSSFVIDRSGSVRLRWVGEISTTALEEYVTPIITE